jgi:hypothetical protein
VSLEGYEDTIELHAHRVPLALQILGQLDQLPQTEPEFGLVHVLVAPDQILKGEVKVLGVNVDKVVVNAQVLVLLIVHVQNGDDSLARLELLLTPDLRLEVLVPFVIHHESLGIFHYEPAVLGP